MSQRAIIEYPDPRLREPCEAVTAFDASLEELVNDLFDTLGTGSAIGLSAPQIGQLKQVLVVHVPDDDYGPRCYINPEILSTAGYGIVEESCVSVPGVVGNVIRHPQVDVRAWDVHGEAFETRLEGMHAVCLQHEMDHLQGKLFIDRLSWFRRLRIRRAARRRAAEVA